MSFQVIRSASHRRSALLGSALLLQVGAALAGATDPGPRGGPPAAGGPLSGLGDAEIAFFNAALAQFVTVDSVSGTLPGESGSGLGPRFNGNVCSACHAYPAVGGSSPPQNPQIPMATLDGAHNTVPSFLQPNGPVREPRFKRHPDGTHDGGVHQIFVISGRSDAPGCTIQQPDFQSEIAAGNVSYRIPSGLFGLGLVENTPDRNLLADDNAHAGFKAALGITGHFNHSSNDGSIMRFGWKAQDKSLLMFAGEAYNVEQGVTNELFPNELAGSPNCQFNNQPEDSTFFVNTINSGSVSSDLSSATVNFAGFMRLSAPPAPAPFSASAVRGQQDFTAIGCESCHFASHTTAPSVYTAQGNVTYFPYSDFELHKMGSGLADGIVQGEATGAEFRTAPLWGIGQRLFFLHDGRTQDLKAAILAHASDGSEANAMIGNFQALSSSEKQDILNFLRAL
jgi:CxxC motif-containing protein (DUF1111 family)